MKRAIQFGAGNIGRGFIGYLLSISGYHVIFADIDEELVKALNDKGGYRVQIAGERIVEVDVKNISALSSLDERLIDEIARADLITTAVGPKALKAIAPTMAKGIQKKKEEKNTSYLNIIPCENMVGAADYLKEQVENYLDEDLKSFMAKYVGFVNCVVDRIVPPSYGKMEDITQVMVEEFSEWIVDSKAFKGDRPKIKGMELKDNLIPYIERKIFTLNTGHAIAAYLGYLKGYTTIRESIMDPDIKAIVLAAMRESGQVLIERYGLDSLAHEEYIQRILSRFLNPHLKDLVTRVARQPLRKLSNGERLIKPLKGTVEYGLENENLIRGIAAALSYDYPEDEEAVEMGRILKDNNTLEAIAKITGLDSSSNIVEKIYKEYINIKREA